ncbi:MAG TPA: nuclear transport factor 2 family protein [Edaphobacter sp.]|nr:nuclear transport factor 2 family protein [Edaphobacter sp.]
MASATLNVRPSTDETNILALIEEHHKAHHNKDAAAIAAPFTRDAAIYNLAPPLAHHGVDLTEKQAWLDTWDGPIDLESRDFNLTVSGDYAFGHGYIQMTGSPKAAGRQISFWMRSTICLHREGSSWKIIHEHTSVPFYMDGTLRPAFDLKP